MFNSEFSEARSELCEKIASVPPEYLKDNAVALMQIIQEFQRSQVLEFRIIQQVKQLNVEDSQKLEDFAMSFNEYVDQRSFDLERTRCSQIGRLYCNQIVALRGGIPSDQDKIKELEQYIKSFINSDLEFIDAIEAAANTALTAVNEIRDFARAGDLARARERQQEFTNKVEGRSRQLKDTITEMNNMGNKIISQL